MKEKLKVLVIEPAKKPYVKEIDHSLEEMQKIVGGSVQSTYPFEELVGLVCNDEAKALPGFYPNRALRDETGKIYDIICGTFFIAGLGEEDFCSLSDELIEKFRGMYDTPELFHLSNNGGGQEYVSEKTPNIKTFSLWMLKDTEENKKYHFMPYKYLQEKGRNISREDYEKVYDGLCVDDKGDSSTVEKIYAAINMKKPEDYHARTFSMGDILVISDEDRNEKAYFCDTFGFVEVPEFLS